MLCDRLSNHSQGFPVAGIVVDYHYKDLSRTVAALASDAAAPAVFRMDLVVAVRMDRENNEMAEQSLHRQAFPASVASAAGAVGCCLYSFDCSKDQEARPSATFQELWQPGPVMSSHLDQVEVAFS